MMSLSAGGTAICLPIMSMSWSCRSSSSLLGLFLTCSPLCKLSFCTISLILGFPLTCCLVMSVTVIVALHMPPTQIIVLHLVLYPMAIVVGRHVEYYHFLKQYAAFRYLHVVTLSHISNLISSANHWILHNCQRWNQCGLAYTCIISFCHFNHSFQYLITGQ